MATITQKEADGSTTLKYVPDVPGPGVPQVPVPPAAAAPPPASTGSNAAGVQGSWEVGADGINKFVPAGTGIKRSIDTPSDPASTFLDTFQQPETASQIAERKRKDAQALIDSTNNLYDTELADTKAAGQKRLDQNNAISVLSGLTGSTEAVRTDREVSSANQKEIDAVNAKRAVALSAIYNKISSDADTEAEQQKQDATKSAEDILARRKQSQSDAITNLTAMAKSGAVDFDAFKNSPQNAKVYQYALDAVGGSEDALRGLFALNRPQDQLVGTPTRVGDHYIQAYKNPLTGKVSYDNIPLPEGIGVNYSTFQKLGDNLVAIPDGWDGDTSKLKTIAGSPSTMERLQQQSLMLDIAKKKQELSGGEVPGYNGEFGATVDLAAQQGGTNQQRAQIKQNLQSFIANGDYPSAYAGIVAATSKGLTGANASNFQQQAASLSVLNDLEGAIKAYADAGGNTNIFKGTVDKVQTKIGALMTDPKYASLAVQLNAAFQQYRLNMTGAAFGKQESAEYASILPQPGNTLDLNLAKLTGAKAYLNSSVEGAIKSVVGQGGVYIKQYAEGATPASSSGSDIKSQVDAAGYDYDAMKADGHTDDEIRSALGL